MRKSSQLTDGRDWSDAHDGWLTAGHAVANNAG